jgi:hypothetical protein
LSHKKAQKGTEKGRIEIGNQLWVYVPFGASSWLKKSGNAEMSLEYAGPIKHVWNMLEPQIQSKLSTPLTRASLTAS